MHPAPILALALALPARQLPAPQPPPRPSARRTCLSVPITITTWTAAEWAALPEPVPGAVECPNGVRFLVEQD